MKDRYVQAKLNGRKGRAHRLLMEAKLGRRLKTSEYVHHKDGNPRNNDPSNLELTDPETHGRLHHLRLPLTWVCEICGATFTPTKYKRGGRKRTCSKVCRYALIVKMRHRAS